MPQLPLHLKNRVKPSPFEKTPAVPVLDRSKAVNFHPINEELEYLSLCGNYLIQWLRSGSYLGYKPYRKADDNEAWYVLIDSRYNDLERVIESVNEYHQTYRADEDV